MSERFVTIGSTSIRKSNIKHFGIGQENGKQYGLFVGIASLVSGEGWKTALAKYSGEAKIDYLFVTTFQGDNHKFYESQVNIKEALKELQS